MGCCNNKKSCSNREPMEAAPNATTEQFLSLEAGAVIIDKLLTAARTGICDVFFRDVKLNELASRIGLLFLENEYLKKLARLVPSRPAVDVTPTSVTIGFGPQAEYQLMIPVQGKQDRMLLADQLFHAALQLKRQEIENDKQQQFEFSGE